MSVVTSNAMFSEAVLRVRVRTGVIGVSNDVIGVFLTDVERAVFDATGVASISVSFDDEVRGIDVHGYSVLLRIQEYL